MRSQTEMELNASALLAVCASLFLWFLIGAAAWWLWEWVKGVR